MKIVSWQLWVQRIKSRAGAQTQLQSSAMFLLWWKRLCFITKTHLIKDTTTNNALEIFENQEHFGLSDGDNSVFLRSMRKMMPIPHLTR